MVKGVKIEITIFTNSTTTNGKGDTFVRKKKNSVHEGKKKNKTLLKG